MTFQGNLRHGQSVNSEIVYDVNECDPWRRLAAEIVISAVEDWRSLIKAKEWEKDASTRKTINFDSLRFFFRSQWCGFLVQHFNTTPETILQLLETELDDAKKADAAERSQIFKKYNRQMGRASRERIRQRDFSDNHKSKGNK